MKQDVFDKLPHLQKRHNKYGIRVRVPDEVQVVLQKREITRTLGTGDPEIAKPIYYEKLKEVLDEIEAAKKLIAKSEAPLLTPEMAKAFATVHFQQVIYNGECLAHRTHNSSTVVETDDGVLIDDAELLLEVSLDLRDARAEGETYTRGIADAILLKNGFPKIIVAPDKSMPEPRRKRVSKQVHVDRASPGYALLLRLSFEGQIEVWERMIAISEGRQNDLAKSQFPKVSSSISSAMHTNSLQLPPQISRGLGDISVDSVFEKYLEAHPNKTERWKLDMQTSFACLLDLKGRHFNANSLTKRDFRELLGFVRSMPTQIGNNKKKWKDMNLREIVAATEKASDYEENLLHPTTVNKYMGRISQAMQWAENEPLIDRNHARGIRIPADEIDDDPKRTSFSLAQLNCLFSREPFTSPKKEYPSLYWASILSLFHGMRSEEILQLRALDVQQDDDGIWFFDIHKRDGNHLKNKSAARKTPIHPLVFKLGFASLVAAANNRTGNSLFPDLSRGAEGKFTPVFSRRFSRHLKAIAQKTETTSFHSFRHTFRDGARNCEISDDRACALAGWQYGAGVQASYGDGLSMEEKFKAIQKLTYSKVDFRKIVIIRW